MKVFKPAPTRQRLLPPASLAVLAAVAIFGGQVLAAQPPAKPNIVYILADDLGYYELSCMGHREMQTPNVDRLAAEGMRFTQMLAGGNVCAPTRSVLMTGQHLGHTSVRSNGGGLALRADDVTIAQVLKQAGYATGGFGKWGLGDRGTVGVPEKHGFDVFFGYYHQVHAHTYFPKYLVRNSELVELPGNDDAFYQGQTFSQYRIVAEAKQFIRANKDRPFFAFLPWTPPHGLWGFPKDDPSWQLYKDKPWTVGQRSKDDAKVYAAMVNMLDRQVGEILSLLQELGLDENTIIFFSGDNGGQPYFADKQHPEGLFSPNVDPRTGQRFRGGKGTLYEGGLRVPFIVRWPGKIKPRQVSDQLGYFADLLPTLAEFAGVSAPTNTDGLSLLPTLLGEKTAGRAQPQHEYLYWEDGPQRAVRCGQWKLVGKPKKWELYDLTADPGEGHDLAADRPELVSKLATFAIQAHTLARPGECLDPTKGFQAAPGLKSYQR
jgi:arylsulfatase A